VDPAVQLQPDARPERAAAGRVLAGGLHAAERRRRGGEPRRAVANERELPAARLRHRRLVAVRPRRFVVGLLELLAEQTGDPAWERWHGRFDAYLHEPPEISARRPVPAIRGRRAARVSFWLSKLSRVTFSVAGEASVVWLGRGSHTLTWSAGRHGRGTYRAFLAAEDVAGNRARVELAPVIVRRR
jgi:hypothetical protein